MTRVNIDILGISELRWTGMGEFNSDDHYIYCCGQESLKRKGVAIMVNKRVRNAVLGCNLKNDRNSRWVISNHKRWCYKSTAVNIQPIWKTQHWPQDWKRSVFILIPKKGNAKACSNNRTIEIISHASKVMLKILQARLQQYVNLEPDVQAGFRKGRGTKLPTSIGSSEKWESSRKNLLYWLCQSLWLCGSQ